MKLRELIKAATPLPWHVETESPEYYYVNSLSGIVLTPPCDERDADDETRANSRLAAHAVNMLPKLVEAMDGVLAAIREDRTVSVNIAAWGQALSEVLAEANNPEGVK